MYKTIGILKFIALLAVGVVLCYFSFSKLNLDELWALIRTGNYWVCIPVYAVSLFGYLMRVQRWELMMRSMSVQTSFSGRFVALCTGYLVNYAVPRLGEITRCMVLRRTDRAPFDKTLLSIVAERTADTIVLLLLVLAAFLLNAANTSAFFMQNIIQPVYSRINPWVVAGAIVLVVAALFIFNRLVNQRFSDETLTSRWNEWMGSLKAIVQLKERTAFLAYTVLIWLCYFLMTYLWLFTFEESASLGVREAFIVMVIGSIGRSIPIQGGGIGAYHYLVSQAFALFGISLLTGNALAIVIHGAQSVLTFLTGILCGAWLLFKINPRSSRP